MELRRVLSESAAQGSEAKQRQEMLKSELSHRLKNILAMVQAIVSQTLRSTKDFKGAREVLSSRIVALARAQDILFAGSVESADLATIVHSAAELHDAELERRFHIDGPPIEVGPKAALSLTLMMHELATNATKYGALSTLEGNVSVGWKVIENSQEPQFSLLWRESGGPTVTPPTRRGFGTSLIEQGLASQVNGTVLLEYLAAGLECRLSAPLSGLYDAI